MVVNGPDTMDVRSMTLMPSSGPGMALAPRGRDVNDCANEIPYTAKNQQAPGRGGISI
jgi:hypothetical protein